MAPKRPKTLQDPSYNNHSTVPRDREERLVERVFDTYRKEKAIWR
jgi:hypothetical protein